MSVETGPPGGGIGIGAGVASAGGGGFAEGGLPTWSIDAQIPSLAEPSSLAITDSAFPFPTAPDSLATNGDPQLGVDASTLMSEEELSAMFAEIENFLNTSVQAEPEILSTDGLDFSQNHTALESFLTDREASAILGLPSQTENIPEAPFMTTNELVDGVSPVTVDQIEEITAKQTFTEQEADEDESVALGKIEVAVKDAMIDTHHAVQAVTQENANGIVTGVDTDVEEQPEVAFAGKTQTAIRDEERNAKRVMKIAAAAEKVRVLTQAGDTQDREVVVSGSKVARLLFDQNIEKDKSLTSPIVPETREDGSLILTLNAVAETDFHEGSIVPAVEGIVNGHTAVTVGHEPKATKEQVEEVLQQGIPKNADIFRARLSLPQAA